MAPRKKTAEVTNEATAKNEAINNGNWNSTTQPKVPMYYMHVEIEWLEKALATLPNNKELLAEYIASKAPDAASKEEEIEAIGEDAVMSKSINVYPKGQFSYDPEHDRFYDCFDKKVETPEGLEVVDNIPYYYNYQIRGFFKDSCGLLSRANTAGEQDGEKIAESESSKLKAYKKVIDGGIFVFPRRVAIELPDQYLDDDGITMIDTHDENGNLRVIQRPMRTSGPTGDRTAIAASEMIPAGSRMKFTIGFTSLKFKPAIIEWLNYACVHGISGWRNSGMGICRWREIKSDYTPFN